MNILPKKKWHVRTKENVARVRRDQRKAAEEERRIKERAELAEQEFKVNLLRKNVEGRMETMYGIRKSTADSTESDAQLAGPSGHVNFFADLEAEDRKNLGTGNPEYELERKKEQEEYEKKIGILQYLGQGSSELTKEKPWYEKIRTKRGSIEEFKKPEVQLSESLRKHAESYNKKKKQHEKRKRKHKHKGSEHKRHRKKSRRHRHSSMETLHSEDESSDSVDESAKKQKLEKLRQERLEREAKERKRLTNLLAPTGNNKEAEGRVVMTYSSQFNPELARQNKGR